MNKFKNGAIVQVFLNNKFFIIGEVLSIDPKWILLHCISAQDGFWDGIRLILKSDIVRTKTRSNEIYRTLKLHSYRNCKSIAVDDLLNCVNCMEALFSFCCRNKYLMSVELLKSDNLDSIGVPIQYDDRYIEIEQYDENGAFDGHSIIRTDYITRCCIMGWYEESVYMLLNGTSPYT